MTEKEVHVLRKGTCPSLSGRSELTYDFGHDGMTFLFRIAENTGSGHYNGCWISLDAVLDRLKTVKEPFSLSVFKNLYPGQSINNTGFLGAALKKEGLIVCERRQYISKDSKAFMADINKLIKTTKPAKTASPTKTTNTPRKPAKAEQQEEPT